MSQDAIARAQLIGVVMVTAGLHCATDVIAGYCVGVAVSLVVALAIDARRDRPAPR